MSQTQQPLRSLAMDQPSTGVSAGQKPNDGANYGYGMGDNIGMLILWFLVIAVIAWLLIYSLKPSWALKPGTDEVDTGKILLASIIIALIIVIIIWLFRTACMKKY